MKTIKNLILTCLLFSLFPVISNAQVNSEAPLTLKKRIEVIDFHSTHRCRTCNAIEANTKYTLQTYFADEMKQGLIIFKVINIDEEENAVLAEKFQATGTSLFLNIHNNGKEKIINLTDFAFAKGRDKKVFSTELKKKLEKQLHKLTR